jgi:hypothetical protein
VSIGSSLDIYHIDIKRRYYSFVKSILWHRFVSKVGFVLVANVKRATVIGEFGIYPEASAAGARVMQRNSDKRRRDPRSIDMAAIIALLALVIAASAVLSEASKESTSPTAIDTTVRW